MRRRGRQQVARTAVLSLVAIFASLDGGCGAGSSENAGTQSWVGKRESAELGPPRSDAAEARPTLSARAVNRFRQLEATLGGPVGVRVGPAGTTTSQALGSIRTGKAWSTIKLAIAARTLADVGGPTRLAPEQRARITRAITASDNAAAAGLFQQLERAHGGLSGASAAIAAPLRAAGDSQTTISTRGVGGFSTYGQTDWSLDRQHRFMSRLAAGCATDEISARYLLGLMGRVVPSQRWGIGSAKAASRFKGGWGPDQSGRYLVRQTGVLDLPGGQIVLTLAAQPSDGQFATGQRVLSRVARFIADNAGRQPPRVTC